MKWTNEVINEIKELIKQNITFVKIAEYYNISSGALGVRLSKYGIKKSELCDKKPTTVKKICKNCNAEFIVKISSDKKFDHKFCNHSCSATYNSKNHRHSDETKNKIRNTLISKNPNRNKICKYCGNIFVSKKIKAKTCSRSCASKLRWSNPEYVQKIKSLAQKRCSTITEKQRLRDIGRLGGFGKRGYTINGTRYDSLFEKKCFDYIESTNIKFNAHKNIPNSSKICDLYLVDYNLWIELDGINREKNKRWLADDYKYWLDKLDIYKINNLKYKIIYKFNEFKTLIDEVSMV